MWTRSARSKVTGKFTVVCTDYSGDLFYTADFDDMNEADRAGESAERRMFAWEQSGRPAPYSLDEALSELSDDELLRELLT